MSQVHDNANEFRSPDLYYASYLMVAGVPMIRTEREGNRVFFVFDTALADLEALKSAWFSNQGRVPAQPYAHAIKSLKSVVHMT